MNNRTILFVDDDRNALDLVVLACRNRGYDIVTSDDPISALEDLRLGKLKPAAIFSDQRMPVLEGTTFLVLAQQHAPLAVPILMTGCDGQDFVIESLREAGIRDFISKPVDYSILYKSIERSLEIYRQAFERQELLLELEKREQLLSETNKSLSLALRELEVSRSKEEVMRKELEAWVPPVISKAIKDGTQIPDQINRDIAGIVFDIVNSGNLLGVKAWDGESLRMKIVSAFSNATLRWSGYIAQVVGDSALGHFGLLDGDESKALMPADSAFAAALDFKSTMENISRFQKSQISCGVALHFTKSASINLHTTTLATPSGVIVQKSFDTSSADVDLLHRVEKLVHKLPGINIILTGQFLVQLSEKPGRCTSLGSRRFPGHDGEIDLFLIPSDRATDEQISALRESILATGSASAA